MDALLVILWCLLMMRIVGLGALILVRRESPAPGRRRADPCLGPLLAIPPEPGPLDEEGRLLEQLRTGGIERDRYHGAMARLAERDAREHPLHVP